MSWWSRAKRAVGAYTGLSGRGRGMLDSVFRSRVGDPPVRGTREFLEVYETSPWVRAVAGRVAKSSGATEWMLTRRGGQPVKNHVLLEALQHPNPQMPGYTLLCLTQ